AWPQVCSCSTSSTPAWGPRWSGFAATSSTVAAEQRRTRPRQPPLALLGRRPRHRCALIEDAPPPARLVGADPCAAEDAVDRPSVEGRLDVVEAHHDRRVAVYRDLDLLGIDRLED